MERPCAWPTLYLEINGNDDDFVLFDFIPDKKNWGIVGFVAQRVSSFLFYKSF